MNTSATGSVVLSLNGFLEPPESPGCEQWTPPDSDNARGDRSVTRGLQRVGLVMTLMAFLAGSTFAQEGNPGIIEGYVYEENTRDPLPGANVFLDGTTQGTATAEDGFYRIEGVEAGTHRLVVTSLGYEREEIEVTISPGETTTQNVTLSTTALELDNVVVTGLRRGQVLAVNEKREALSVVDVVSADEAGKLPDLNVAESTQRIPGVTIRTDNGEGRFVSIRGTPPNRNNVMFNGQAMASAAGSRATALDLVPSEMVSTIEVAKAVTPDMDANALGGTVNINTLTAFDREGSFLSASFNGMQHQLTTDWGEEHFPFRGSLTAGTRFGANDAWGIVLSGTASRRTFNTAAVSPGDWIEVNGIAAPEEYERQIEDNDRFRYSVNANLDFRPTPRTATYARLHYSQRDERFKSTEIIFAGGDPVPASATTGRLENFESQLDIPTSDEDHKLYALTLGLDQQFGNHVNWEAHGTYSRGELNELTYQPEWGEDQNFSLDYDINGDFEALFYDSAVENPENYVFTEMDIEFQDLRENTWQFATDLRWDLRFGEHVGFLKAGGKFLLRDKDIDRNEDPWAAGSIPLTLGQFALPTPGPLQGGAKVPVTGDVDQFLEFWRQNQDVDYFSLDPIESAEEEVEVDAYVTEDVYAGYLMGNARVGAFTATGGLRVEATSTTSERYRFVNDPTSENAIISRVSASNHYIDFLPSLHLIYRLSDKLQVRGAWSNTIGRPDYDELAAFQDVEFEEVEPGIWEASIAEGNPDLEPLRSMNFDTSIEYYWRPGALLSLGAFYKRITNPIFDFEFTERDVFGRDFAIDIQDITGFDDRFFQEVDFEQLRNADEGYVRGIEISFLQLFDFLPGPLKGLGISSNVTIMNSEVTVPDREEDDLPFFDQSDLVYNIAPYYQTGPLELRVAINYQSEFLDAVGSELFEDSYEDERFTIDLSGRYEFMDGRLQLNAYVRNLTNAPEREFQFRRHQRSFHALTGRTFELGIAVNL